MIEAVCKLCDEPTDQWVKVACRVEKRRGIGSEPNEERYMSAVVCVGCVDAVVRRARVVVRDPPEGGGE